MDHQQVSAILAGLGVISLLAWRGCLSGSAFNRAPGRDGAGLGLRDLLAGVTLMVAGSILAGGVIHTLGDQLPRLPEDPGEQLTDAVIRAHTLIALLGQVFSQGLIVAYLLWRVSATGGGMRALGVVPGRPLRDVGAGLLGLIVAMPIVFGASSLSVEIGRWMGDVPPEVGHEMLNWLAWSQTGITRALLLGSALVVAPVFEEVIFRGLIQTVFVTHLAGVNRWLPVTAAAAVFAMVHLGQPWQVLPGLFCLGLVLGWLYERTGSLWPCVVTHAGFNGCNVMLVLLSR